MVGLCLPLVAHTGEVEARDALASDFATAFRISDFAAIESRYAQALATKKRLPSGLFASNRMVALMFSQSGSRGLDWEAAQEKARAWAAQFPKSVLPALALNRIHSERAWAARGRGYSSEVTQKDWRVFNEHMSKAREALESRAEVGRGDPNWWYQLLVLAREQGWPMREYSAIADLALAAFPEHVDIYRAISLKLVPQWGGSWEALAKFADQAAARTVRLEGKTAPARMYWHVANYFGPGQLTRPEGNWPTLRASFEDLVARYPDSWNLNGYARFACDAGDKEAAKRMLGRIGNSVVPSVWANIAMFNRCRSWALT